MEIFIYIITNIVNGMKYVGQTTNMKKRWGEHCNKKSKCRLLRDAIQSFGQEYFTMEQICTAANNTEASILEDKYIMEYDTLNPDKGYNLSTNSHGVSEDTREKLRISSSNRKMTGEWRENWLQSADIIHDSWRGQHHTEETKQVMREQKLGDKNPMYGKTHTDEVKQKMSETRKGKKRPPEVYEKIRIANQKITDKQKEELIHQGQEMIATGATTKQAVYEALAKIYPLSTSRIKALIRGK